MKFKFKRFHGLTTFKFLTELLEELRWTRIQRLNIMADLLNTLPDNQAYQLIVLVEYVSEIRGGPYPCTCYLNVFVFHDVSDLYSVMTKNNMMLHHKMTKRVL